MVERGTLTVWCSLRCWYYPRWMWGSPPGPVPGKEQSQTLLMTAFPWWWERRTADYHCWISFSPGQSDLLMANSGNFFAAECINTVFIFCGLSCWDRKKKRTTTKKNPNKNQAAVSKPVFYSPPLSACMAPRAHIFMEDPNTGSNSL